MIPPPPSLVGHLRLSRLKRSRRRTASRIFAAAITTLLALGVIVPINSAAAQTAPQAPAPDCGGESAAVLVDASSEPDLYAAFLLAGVLDTGCLVDAGDRNGALPAESQTLLETNTLTDGYAVGGTAAVPAAKLIGELSWRRAGGTDRWATLRIIGGAAADPTTLPAAADTTSPSVSTGRPAADCANQAAAVLVDASSEPDLYAAFLLAGVLDTGCLVDAGDRNGALPTESGSLLETGTLENGYAVGGTAAVPAAKLIGELSWRRAGGTDRWATLRIIGGAAANPTTLPATDSASAAQPEGTAAETANGFTAVSSGLWHSCGRRASGEAICWGNNGWGQASPPSGQFIAITAGRSHSCGLRPSGAAVCWGISDDSDNDYGQVSGTPSGRFTTVATSSRHSCALRISGEAVCWGGNWSGQATPPSATLAAISTGWAHSCGLRPSGEAVCWGVNDGSDNDYGQVSDTPTGTFTTISAGSATLAGCARRTKRSAGASTTAATTTTGKCPTHRQAPSSQSPQAPCTLAGCARRAKRSAGASATTATTTTGKCPTHRQAHSSRFPRTTFIRAACVPRVR